VARSDDGGTEDQPRALVRSSGRCREVRRRPGAAVRGGSTMASTAATGRGGGKGCSTGAGRGGAPFIATGGGWQMAARVAVRRRHCLDRVADERGPHCFIFSQIIQTGSNIEM
jgi:hypothetical protein